ncbi:hypothetical protein WJX74_009650 [Apatococcus lobatus]|uniref:Uncharacterized protein n=1 Tax=Apatococcus lobatus TaxID=904363 RepID=A0AAW1SB15_9CHLO
MMATSCRHTPAAEIQRQPDLCFIGIHRPNLHLVCHLCPQTPTGKAEDWSTQKMHGGMPRNFPCHCHQQLQHLGQGSSLIVPWFIHRRPHQLLSAARSPVHLNAHQEPMTLANEPALPIYLFGVDHLASEFHQAEFILQERPVAVVVETALSEEHGSSTGNTICLDDASMTSQNPYASLGFHLAAMSLDRATALCRDLADRQMPPEQLIYAAALASGSQLVYGDVPKLSSIRRLWEQATLQELDQHFSRQTAANFGSLLNEGAVVIPDTPACNRAFQILFSEREAAFCQVLQACSQQLNPETWAQSQQGIPDTQPFSRNTNKIGSLATPSLTTASQSNAVQPQHRGSWAGQDCDGGDAQPGVQLKAGAGLGGSIVGIVGEDHVKGIQQAWALARKSSPKSSSAHASAASEAQLSMSTAEAFSATDSPVPNRQALADRSQWTSTRQGNGGIDGIENAGVKRALLERMLGLAIPEDLAFTLCQQALGPLAPSDADAYQCCSELYGSSRMLLACLQPSELKQVCEGWNCDMWTILDPVRRLQPLLGGPGFDWDVVYELKCLNFEL